MPADDVTGGPKQLNIAQLILDARALLVESELLIKQSNLLFDNCCDLLACVLMRHIEPRSR